MEIKIRPATFADMRSVFELSNDNIVRANSINTNKVAWEDHIKWFTERLARKDSLFFIVEDATGAFVGQVRIDNKNGLNLISISIAAAFRSKGLGSKIIKEASALSDFKSITAYIRQDNQASCKSFLKAGYREAGAEVIEGVKYCLLRYDK